MELLQCLPAGPQAGWVSKRASRRTRSASVQGVAASQQREPCSEHFGVEGGLGAFRPALDVAADLGGPDRGPSDGMEAVQYMAGVALVGVDGGLVGLVASKTLTAQPNCGARPSPGCGRCRR